jgi:hypothetical protein
MSWLRRAVRAPRPRTENIGRILLRSLAPLTAAIITELGIEEAYREAV